MQVQPLKKVLLIILDGFGIRSEATFNAIQHAVTPNWDNYQKSYAFGTLDASGTVVGLPPGQFGNSEVGHLNIGAGRVVQQDITRIDCAINSGAFFTNPALLEAVTTAVSGNVHIMGLLSDGGVHAHIKHIFALIELASKAENVHTVWIHAFLDGRDTPPQSASQYLTLLNRLLHQFPKAKIATLSGRYYAMDRDKRYDRLQLAYEAIVAARSATAVNGDALDVLHMAYANGTSDEFVKPCVIGNYPGIQAGDSVIFANFRSDRAIQLTEAMISAEFDHFKRKEVSFAAFVTMTEYDAKFKVKVAFPANIIYNTLGEYISNLGYKQLRVAETEKYPHVTYFFNGGRKDPYPNEDRILVASPRDVATYDLKPEMSLPEVSEKLVQAIHTNQYDFIITNFANGDMVGHTGNFNAAIKAVNALDRALGQVVSAMLTQGGEVLIIADHGNCEEMFNAKVQQVHTQHTTNLVPCLYIGRAAEIKPGGSLQDVAPTLLAMSGLSQPQEMTGTNLIKLI
jgi:2,3-bisphosphoglycerate-independent phosphoglycerate mutase